MLKKLWMAWMLVALGAISLSAKVYKFDVKSPPGWNILYQSVSGVDVEFAMPSLRIKKVSIKGEDMDVLSCPGIFMGWNEEGAPNLPVSGRWVAVPNGAEVRVEIVDVKKKVFHNINVAPMFKIPLEIDDSPLQYEKNPEIYGKDEYYPKNIIMVSKKHNIRGVEAVVVSVVPFQYNPVKKELVVYYDVKFRIKFIGGSGYFGEDRLRHPLWDWLYSQTFINYASLPKIDYSKRNKNKGYGYEYVIIIPDDPVFEAWADTIKRWRTLEGFKTGVFKISDIGSNNASVIDAWIENAYNTWDIPPIAVLLLSDYQNSGKGYGIDAWTVYHPDADSCKSDAPYAAIDEENDTLPDIYIGRITAQNGSHLEAMITKMLENERSPSIDPDVYDKPLLACGWEDERWFQLCVEVIKGFWVNVLGKNPTTQYKVYWGSPSQGCPWSTAQNTDLVVDYFGPNGLGYVDSVNPYPYSYWNNGSASGINNAINQGTFILQHRDHGSETGWGKPSYHISDLSGLNNDVYPFVFSINCLTGKFNWSSECFAEAFHRYPHRALGVNAASEVSYSFVNDTYVWGYIDGLWPEFDPDYPSSNLPSEPPYRIMMPALAVAYGKYYLYAKNWPWNPEKKNITVNLFHHHGDVFLKMYSEVPESISVSHDTVIIGGSNVFHITAEDSSWIALVNESGEIIGEAEGTGYSQTITIEPQLPGTHVYLTVTKYNKFRYEKIIDVISAAGAWVIGTSPDITESAGNFNGVINPGETIELYLYAKNVGSSNAYGVYGILTTSDPYITIIQDSVYFGTIYAGDSVYTPYPYKFFVSSNAPNSHNFTLTLTFHDENDSTWTHDLSFVIYKPVLDYAGSDIINDDNGNGILDPGEDADLFVNIANIGGDTSYSVYGKLVSLDPYLTVTDSLSTFGLIANGDTVNNSSDLFSIHASSSAPTGYGASAKLIIWNEYGDYDTFNLSIVIGAKHFYVWDPDPNHSSGPVIASILEDTFGLIGDYGTELPPYDSLEGKYLSLWVFCGQFSNNYVITEGSQEATTIENFIQNGGRCYLEGGDVWYWDPAYGGGHDFGPTFGLDAVNDGPSGGGISSVQGLNFLSGISASYAGEQNWVDELKPISSGAFSIMKRIPSGNASDTIMVAYNSGTYKTVGASIELSGLGSATKDVVEQILIFFDLWTGIKEGYTLNKFNRFIFKAYPNPFRRVLNVYLVLPSDDKVSIKVFDLSGRKVLSVYEGRLKRGEYNFKIKSDKLHAGVYFLKVKTSKKNLTKKILLAK